MVVIDRVFCDFCRCLLGQIFSVPAQARDLLSALGTSPHFCVCPDCVMGYEVLPQTLLIGNAVTGVE